MWMLRSLPALLALAATACVGGAKPGTGPGEGQVTVFVENTTQDMLHITGRGTTGVRVQPGRSACIRLTAFQGRMRLLATPLAARNDGPTFNPRRTPVSGERTTGGADVVRSPEFVPSDNPAWHWRLGVAATGSNDLVPAESPCM